MPADTSVTEFYSENFPVTVKKSERVTEGEDSPCWKTAVMFRRIKRDLVHCISKVYVLSTK